MTSLDQRYGSRADGPAPFPELPPGATILQVIPSLVTGGAERGCIDVAAAIMQAGGRAIVASSGGPMARELDRWGATHVTLPLARKNPLTIRRNVGRLADLIVESKVSLVHARSRAPAWSAHWAARETGIPFMTTFHAPYNAQNRLKRLYNSVMARGDRVIAISDFVARHITGTYGTDPARIRTIHRGIDLEAFNPARVTAERMMKLARRWAVPDGVSIVMLPGRLTRWKGAQVLLRALERLGRRDVCCLLVGADQGRDRYKDEIMAEIRARGLEGVVRLTGNCDDMPSAYMLADVVVSASIEPEAFGRVIVEAQAMGRPTIVSDIGAVDETVGRGRTAWVVPPGDADALSAAIGQALALDTDEREALGAAAMDHVRERFDRRTMVARTIEVYRELLGASPG
jgi:glycosyltransferase involved in cell wall biosynthesis